MLININPISRPTNRGLTFLMVINKFLRKPTIKWKNQAPTVNTLILKRKIFIKFIVIHNMLPILNDNELFGRLILEINQAGLSTTVLKQVNIKKAFSNFNIKK